MAVESDTVDAETYICEWCGGVIEHHGQECPALDEGRCRP